MSQGGAVLADMGQVQLAALSEISNTQGGCFSLGQSTQVGLSRHQIRRLETTGFIVRVHPRSYRFAGAPVVESTLNWAALLHAGPCAVVSHEAALRAHGFGPVRYRSVVSVPPRFNNDMTKVRVHRFCDLLDEHIMTIDGMRVTTLPRA